MWNLRAGFTPTAPTTTKKASSCSNKIYHFSVEDSFIHF